MQSLQHTPQTYTYMNTYTYAISLLFSRCPFFHVCHPALPQFFFGAFRHTLYTHMRACVHLFLFVSCLLPSVCSSPVLALCVAVFFFVSLFLRLLFFNARCLSVLYSSPLLLLLSSTSSSSRPLFALFLCVRAPARFFASLLLPCSLALFSQRFVLPPSHKASTDVDTRIYCTHETRPLFLPPPHLSHPPPFATASSPYRFRLTLLRFFFLRSVVHREGEVGGRRRSRVWGRAGSFSLSAYRLFYFLFDLFFVVCRFFVFPCLPCGAADFIVRVCVYACVFSSHSDNKTKQ